MPWRRSRPMPERGCRRRRPGRRRSSTCRSRPHLDAVRVNPPVVRIERSVQVRPVARRQEPPHPDVELVRHLELRDGVEDLKIGLLAAVRRAQRPSVVDVGVHHELDVAGGRPIHVEAQAVDAEVFGWVAVLRFAVQEAGLQTGAERDRRRARLLLLLGIQRSGHRGPTRQYRQQRDTAPSRDRGVVTTSSVAEHQRCPPWRGRARRLRQVGPGRAPSGVRHGYQARTMPVLGVGRSAARGRCINTARNRHFWRGDSQSEGSQRRERNRHKRRRLALGSTRM